MGKSIHPDIKKFKLFVKNHPYVLRDVKAGEKSLQDLYEEWALFGEEDDIWETYKTDEDDQQEEEKESNEAGDETGAEEEETGGEKKTAQDLLSMLKKMNLNDLQGHLSQFSGVLASVQELLEQFRPGPPSQNSGGGEQRQPFSYTDD